MKVRFAVDSPLEEARFEPSVPRKETTLVGRPRSIPRNSPSAKETGSFAPGTDGSNPPPSSGESAANSTPRLRRPVSCEPRARTADSRIGTRETTSKLLRPLSAHPSRSRSLRRLRWCPCTGPRILVAVLSRGPSFTTRGGDFCRLRCERSSISSRSIDCDQ